jgi:D-alanyl-D-alanine carboxypeptidase
VCVTIDDGNDWQDHKQMHESGFCEFCPAILVEKGQEIGTMAVFGGLEESVNLIAAEDFTFLLAEGEKISFRLPAKEFAYAPILENADAGFAYVCIDGKPIGKVPVIFGKTIEMPTQKKEKFWDKLFGGKS